MDDIRAIQVGILNYGFIKSLFKDLPTNRDDDPWEELTSLGIVMLDEPLVFVVNNSTGFAEFFDMTCFRKDFNGEIQTSEFTPVTRK